jgi:hypothetical protein
MVKELRERLKKIVKKERKLNNRRGIEGHRGVYSITTESRCTLSRVQ